MKIAVVERVEKTGITPDYWNEFLCLKHKIVKYCCEPEKAYDSLKMLKIKKYAERVNIRDNTDRNKEAYKITEKNKTKVKCLDKLVDEINFMLEDYEKFNCKKMETLVNVAYVFIYGESEEYHKSKVNKENNDNLSKVQKTNFLYP